MSPKQITEGMYLELQSIAPNCNYCTKYAIKRCAFGYRYFINGGCYYGSASYQLCENCPPPKKEFNHLNYKVWIDDKWVKLSNLLLSYEAYSKLDRINKFA